MKQEETHRGLAELRNVLLLSVLVVLLAATPLQAAQADTLEGETFSLPTGSGQVRDDANASGGKTLLTWSNDTASKGFTVPDGYRATEVRARVRADQCEGSPQMTIYADGAQSRQDWVWQTSYTDYASAVDLAPGTHTVKVAMAHDYNTAVCDRNLYLDKVTVSLSATSAAPAPAPATGSDVFEGTKLYVDPNSNAKRQADAWRSSRPEDARLMDKIAAGAGANWFGDWSGDVRAAVDARVTQITEAGALPVLVAYDIPNRDCSGQSAGGAPSPEAYKTWIRAFAAGIEGRKVAVVIEPDAVALTSCLSEAERTTRFALLKDAVNVLEAQGKTATYIDAGHSSWIPASEMGARLTDAGVGPADGFSLNISNFRTTPESTSYGKDLSSRVGGDHFVIDTARNGLGPSPDDQWCNPPGRALGEKPGSATADPSVDAYLWIKPPGESDGACNGGPPAGQWWPEYALGLAQRASY